MYEIEYSPGPGFMRADVAGDLAAPDTRIEAWGRIIHHCRAKAVTRLEIENRCQVCDSAIFAVYGFSARASGVGEFAVGGEFLEEIVPGL